jgi:uncharacterized protein
MVDTPVGPARLELREPQRSPVSLLLLGHGAGGDVTARDLAAVTRLAVAGGVLVGLVTQPYRVAGRRSTPPTAQLDRAWTAVVAVAAGKADGLPMVFGGRSSGARVACRTAAALGAAGVVALAFPLHPPGRPEASRAGELDPAVPTLVVNGGSDPFGVPEPAGLVEVVVRPGERHDLGQDPVSVASTVVDWLRRHGWAAAAS